MIYSLNDRTSESGFTGRLRAAAVIALPVGAVGSLGLMLEAGRNAPRLLLVLFTFWVLSPFLVLAVANLVSKRWLVLTRAALHGVILVLTVGSLAIYADVALAPAGTRSAFVFVVVPPASWLLIASVVSIAGLIAGRQAREVSVPDTGLQRLARRIFKGFAGLAVVGVLGVGALLGLLWLEHRTSITLPTPTGSFAVGRAIHDWTDDATLDLLAPVPGTKRELLVWIWYPSAGGPSATLVSDYVPAELRPKAEDVGGANIWTLLTRDASKVRGHSTRDPDVSPQQRSYPVVIMRAGASSGVLNYSTLAEDLASHGYVVVGFDAPYRTGLVVFPDGRVMRRTPENDPELCLSRLGEERARCVNKLLTAWTADIAFVLDRLERLNSADSSGSFAGRLDLTRVGVFGHSFGGATAAQFCYEDSRCKAGIDVDGAPHGSVIRAGLQQPFMFLLSDHGDSSDPVSRQIQADIQSIHDRQPPAGRLRVAIRGANHFTFSDDGALLKSRIVRGVLRMSGRLGIDGRRQLAVTAHCVHSFFDAYLEGASRSLLELSSPHYPEIQVLE